MEIDSQNQSSMSLLSSENGPTRVEELTSIAKNLIRTQKSSEPDFVESGLSKEKYSKKYLLYIFLFLVTAVPLYAIFSSFGLLKSKRDAKNIQVSSGAVLMNLRENEILAALDEKEKITFATSEGEIDSVNTGYFIVIPINKTGFQPESYGESESSRYKIRINLIAVNPSVERKLQALEGLVKKGNTVLFEIEGSNMVDIQKIDGELIEVSSASRYFLADSLKIVEEQYQR